MSFLLLGARGTGKTWLLRHLFRDEAALWINLLEHRDFLKYRARPGLLREEIVAILRGGRISGDSVWVIIDEVQRVPELLNEVHAMVEDAEIQGEQWGDPSTERLQRGPIVKFGLSGSSARKLKRGGANLLAGRALLNHLYPLTADELGKDFDLNATLNWGLLPSVVTQSDPIVRRELLETYVAVYLREEIREEQHLRNLDPFIRFLEVAAQTSGQIVNYSAIGRDCSVDSRAVARYFQILEETLLGFLLPPFDRSVRKQQGKSPKFYLFDIGVMRTLERTVTIPINPGSYGYGRLFEHFVMWEIIKCNEYSRRRYKLSYLVTKDGAEIDLIVERPGKATVLIEIKSGINPKIQDARHAVRFREDFGNAEVWVVSQIERERIEAGVRFFGWQEALRELFKEGEPEPRYI